MCWLRSSPGQRGFRKRMYDIYHGQNPETTASEPLLAGQIRSVLNCKVFSELELEEFRRELASGSSVVVDSPDSSPLRLESYTPSVGETGEHSLQSPTVDMDSGHFWITLISLVKIDLCLPRCMNILQFYLKRLSQSAQYYHHYVLLPKRY